MSSSSSSAPRIWVGNYNMHLPALCCQYSQIHSRLHRIFTPYCTCFLTSSYSSTCLPLICLKAYALIVLESSRVQEYDYLRLFFFASLGCYILAGSDFDNRIMSFIGSHFLPRRGNTVIRRIFSLSIANVLLFQ